MTARSLVAIRRRVLDWFAREQRDLPWRRTRDPWAVLVSEVMLQQTQASRIAERFPPFLIRFPTAASMAAASDAEVLAAWSGLGYNRRALNLRRAAGTIVEAGWPRDVEGLRRLPGIGPYTARAVAALAFGEAVGAVHTNVRRWLIRRFALADGVGIRELQTLADALATVGADRIGPSEAATWMHASMEFGARICVARAPRCAVCPIAPGCPSRLTTRPVPVGRRPAFSASSRQRRGAVVRALVAARHHAVPIAELRSIGDVEELLVGLERDGLAHRSGTLARLGGRAAGRSTSTIKP